MSLRRSLSVLTALAVAILATLALGFSSPAGAADNPDYTAPAPTTVVVTPTEPAQPQAVRAAAPTAQRLAITGSDSAQLAVVGGVLLLGGAAILVARKRVAA